ncbi:hypothetical protein [Cellulomonas xylanilytica]|uniref:Ceramidase n=1 Tax=Cellulomonas xylanilytica TaxID=233583 RepID=A0A510V6W9_9CELL|nr:hypothetical protein [Cellulomonas xylanilytica]GEK21030.1 hypothetical protein CXY01_15500 [Cellulomonas xylanilytica]
MTVASWGLRGTEVVRGPQCEGVTEGPWVEPVSALTSWSFVVGAVLIVALARPTVDTRASWVRVRTYAVLVAAVGIGSFVEHGPDPAWSDVAHDLPLLATLAFLGADAAADLAGRTRSWWMWTLPTAVVLPVVALAPRAGDVAQVALAAAAVLLTVLRARAQPRLRRPVTVGLALLAVGAGIGTMSRAGWPWCDPSSPWQGHGAWHVLAAAALVVMAPTVGHVGRLGPRFARPARRSRGPS